MALVRAGDLDAAAEAYEAALPDLRVAGNALAVGRSIGDLAAIAIARGDPGRAVRLCEAELERDSAGSTRRRAPPCGPPWRGPEPSSGRSSSPMSPRAEPSSSPPVPAMRRARGPRRRRSTASGRCLAGGRRRPPADAPQADPDDLVEPLTARELEVLRLVALGRSNSQIATELFVTVGTVKSHLHTISGKLGAANRVEAVARGRELGLIG